MFSDGVSFVFLLPPLKDELKDFEVVSNLQQLNCSLECFTHSRIFNAVFFIYLIRANLDF